MVEYALLLEHSLAGLATFFDGLLSMFLETGIDVGGVMIPLPVALVVVVLALVLAIRRF